MTTNSSGTSTGSIKFFSFGQTRSGTVTVAQKFTGQRLDSTGLYYYGARYYDPEIGRFISADTIVPDPANPQSLNRYSYCLNNPLKYVDPSGNVVEIYGIDTSTLTSEDYLWINLYCGSEVTDLFNAYGLLTLAAPDLTNALENDPTVITIQWKDLPKNYGGETSGNIMSFNSNRTWSTESLASVMGHESFHQLMDLLGFTADSAYEEACAFSYQSAIEKALGGGGFGGWWDRTWNHPYDEMKFNSSYEWVDNFVKKGFWQHYGGDALWHYENVETSPNNFIRKQISFNYTPWEGGYEAMHPLFVQYFPK